MEARVTGPGITPSNPFRIEPGPGTARIRVDSGSSTARTLGIGALVIGMPVAMGGLLTYGYGRAEDRAGLRTAGLVTLVVGAVASLGALPLLAVGTTTVRNGNGSVIAATGFGPRL